MPGNDRTRRIALIATKSQAETWPDSFVSRI
jgi:hypothetical protein